MPYKLATNVHEGDVVQAPTISATEWLTVDRIGRNGGYIIIEGHGVDGFQRQLNRWPEEYVTVKGATS